MHTNQTISNFGAAATCDEDPNLRCVEEIPPPFHQIFSKFRSFNVLQSQVFDEVFYTDNPLVIAAPTGSGKTVIFELAIAKLLTNVKYNNGNPSFKIVYVAPMKALCEERMLDWHARFNEFGINCISVTGDSDIFDCRSLMSHNLIVTTPEKWDAITRKWKDNKSFVEAIKLFMIDEIHLLNEDTRGPTLEAVVSRMKIIHSYMGVTHNIRFIALSATIPNAEDIAEWLDQCSTNPAKCFKFSEDARPVKLTKVVHGYPFNPLHSTPFKFDIMLNYKLQPVMLKYAQGKPVLIFCSTRKSVEMTAKHLMLNITVDLTAEQKRLLEEAAATITDSNVRSLLVHGIACHHAGMLPENRRAVETLFREGRLPILVATSTLAMGVNLPAHLVIVKTTKQYVNGEYRSYSESAIQQMIGRAGRQGFDTSAVAVIMTTAEEKQKYENMVDCNQKVESNFHLHLTEHLNSEVVLGTISDLPVAMEWLTSTFFYLRAKKHPKHYGLPVGLTTDQLDKKLIEMCQIEINKLAKAGMLSIDETTSITPMLLGYLMAKYYLAFDTIKLFKAINGSEILPQMLNVISNCKEFSDLYLRVNDKKALNLLNKCRNKETIRFPLNGRIKTLGMKINCLIQAVFGCLEVLEHSLQNDAQKIMRSGERISKCLLDYLESSDFIEGHPKAYSALLSANILAKCFHTRLWENSKHVARQLPGIGVALSSQLVTAGKTNFDAILEANPRDLERILGRKPPLGNNIQELVAHLPKYILQMSHEKSEKSTMIKINITLTNPTEIETKCTADKNSYMVLLVGDSFNNIYFYEKYSHDFMVENGEIQKCFQVSCLENCQVNVHFISQTWVGIDCNEKLVLNLKQEKEKPTREKQKKPLTNQKQAKEKNDTVKKPPVTIQQFIDAYMKQTKPISNRAEAHASNSPKGEVERQKTPPKHQSDAPDSYNETSESDNDSLEEEENAKSNRNDGEKRNGEDDEQEEDEEKIVFDIMDEQYDEICSENDECCVTEEPVLKNIDDKNTANNQECKISKSSLESVFKDDEDFNTFCDQQLHPDSTSCEQQINSNTFGKPKNVFYYTQQAQVNAKMRKNNENTQKTISWRSPLIISPAVNNPPNVNVFEESSESEKENLHYENKSCQDKSPDFSVKLLNNRSSNVNVFKTTSEPRKNEDYTSYEAKHKLSNFSVKLLNNVSEKSESNTNKSCQDKSPGFSVKMLDNSYAAPALKSLTQYSQLGPLKKQSLKFQLADKPYKSQTQPHYSEKLSENLNPPKIIERPSQLQNNFHYQTIKIIDRKRQEHSPQLSNDYASRYESTALESGFKRNFQEPTQKFHLKSFLNQFKKDDKKKVNDIAHASTQTVHSKWNRFMGDTENYEATPSCSKWDDYLPKEDEEYSFISQSPPMKRKSSTCFKFDSLPQNPVAKRPTTTYNFLELGLRQERPVYSRPRSPPQQYSRQFVNFVDTPQFREPNFAPVTQEGRVFFSQQLVPHNQYFPQPALHYLPPPSIFPPQTQCTHCTCCQGGGGGGSSGYYNSPPKRGPYMPSYSTCQPNEEQYVEDF